MRSPGIWIVFLFAAWLGRAQECPDLLQPLPGSNNVPVTTTISWEEVIGVTGYIISIGTTNGGGEIINEQAVGSDTSFQPPFGLPESTQIFVTITLFIFDQPNIVCPSQWFTTRDETTVPDCTMLTSPQNGETGVALSANLNWSYAGRALGYRINIGTTAGGGEIINNQDLGNVLFFDPPDDFPPETEIFVQLLPYNENGQAAGCLIESFITGEAGQPPPCTRLISPMDGAINVALSPIVKWEAVQGAEGYIVTIGSSPFNNDVLDEAIFFETQVSILNFEPNSTYYVEIIPFNEAGRAQGCEQESFSTILGCGPFIDEDTGELIFLGPEINFPDTVGACDGQLPTRVTSDDNADGFRWFQLREGQEELLISDEPFVNISEPGLYRYEAYNVLVQGEFEIECPAGKVFEVVLSGRATIDRLNIDQVGRFFDVSVEVSGIGDYEYALNNIEGPYSDTSEFRSLPRGSYVLYVRDKNGCGIVEREFRLAFPPPGFPPYFSPNGDGINDFWQYVRPEVDPLPLTIIYIYDRYGKILANFSPNGQGWDGTYNGAMMPSEGYWYRALTSDGEVFTGNFSLVR